ncbi:hypothetical protein [Mucilaginibacter sp. KACC 22063]|uniref:hypothetical protein n=1 Tax=Mucilaginibacter sp. KACC 22063 TaxID=3025666 RepID=UPI00236504EF|nr:hypothetical protein [Mucilaginibacter sp. KACC 22063]WDF55856.1 hypothetical protein PQ461_02115 [Mucilaginibacter sp. KACC 22063]
MLRISKQAGEDGVENLIQNSIFPAWKCGNMITNLLNANRSQNDTLVEWQYNRFLQIQKSGNIFYVRTSNDGINLADLPGSPLTRPDMNNRNLQIGLYHSTYGPNDSCVKFSNL